MREKLSGGIEKKEKKDKTKKRGVKSGIVAFSLANVLLSGSESTLHPESRWPSLTESVDITHTQPDDSFIDIPPIHPSKDTKDEDVQPIKLGEVRSFNGKLHFMDQTKSGLPSEVKEDLLVPLVKESILSSAFDQGLDSVLLLDSGPSKEKFGFINGYREKDTSAPEQTIVLSFSEKTKITTGEYRNILRHEVIHGITQSNPLSSANSENPPKEELRRWQTACSDIRDIALDEAKPHTKKLLQIMENGKDVFSGPTTYPAFTQVYDALKKGQFDIFEASPEDIEPGYFVKIPECKVVGPTPVFVKFAKAYGEIVQVGGQAERTAEMNKILKAMHYEWEEIIENDTLYATFREGSYGGKKDAGHPQDGWDELTASVANILIGNPKGLEKKLPLSAAERKSAKQLIALTISTLDNHVPKEDTAFHTSFPSR